MDVFFGTVKAYALARKQADGTGENGKSRGGVQERGQAEVLVFTR